MRPSDAPMTSAGAGVWQPARLGKVIVVSMSYSRNSGVYIGEVYGVFKGDTKSSDYSSRRSTLGNSA